MEHHNIYIVSNNEEYFVAIKDFLQFLNFKLPHNTYKVKYNSVKALKSVHPKLLKNTKVIAYFENENNQDYKLLSFIDINLSKYLISHCINQNNCANVLYWHNDIDKLHNELQDFLNITIDKSLLISILLNKKKIKDKTTIKQKAKKHIKINKNSLINNSEKNKKLVYDISNALCKETLLIEDKYYGDKNLIYFTVFGSEYIGLLQYCLDSIAHHTPDPNFDILFICDNLTQKKLNTIKILDNFTKFFHIVPTPQDGIEASMQKCKIFEFINIDRYNNVLFLDCDMLCIKNANKIFNQTIDYNCFYVSYRKNLEVDAFNYSTHALLPLSTTDLDILFKHNQKPFNAGQFLFKNSLKMKQHFINILWLIDNWPGEYFFEQAFLVSYFTKNLLSNCSLKDTIVVNISSFNNKLFKAHNTNTIFIHFAGDTLNAENKSSYIQKYCQEHNLWLS